MGRNEFPFPPVGLEASVEGPNGQTAGQSGPWELEIKIRESLGQCCEAMDWEEKRHREKGRR